MENHRNIPIMHVPREVGTTRGIKGATLFEVLNSNKDILRVSHDPKEDKVHVSTYASKYKTLHQWISQTLREHQFPYAPYTRPLKFNGTTTKFSSVISATTSVTSMSEATQKTNKSTPWKKRPPLNISYILSSEAFPPLPKIQGKSQATAPSTASETLDEDTIQSAISVALSKLEAKHKAELESLKHNMQQQMEALEQQMKDMSKQVAVQTYQALVNESSPLVTKSDHAVMQHEINTISVQLATVLRLLQAGTSSSIPASSAVPSASVDNAPCTPRITKRTKPSTPPGKPKHLDYLLTQENIDSSATSDPDEGMEGCEE